MPSELNFTQNSIAELSCQWKSDGEIPGATLQSRCLPGSGPIPSLPAGSRPP